MGSQTQGFLIRIRNRGLRADMDGNRDGGWVGPSAGGGEPGGKGVDGET